MVNVEIMKECFKPCEFTSSGSKSPILNFSKRARDSLLLLSEPINRTGAKLNEKTCGGFASEWTTSPV
jgi:hypothetical protein